MKHLISVVVFLFVMVAQGFAQNINTPENFPDPKFRALVEQYMGVQPSGSFTAEQAGAKKGVFDISYQGLTILSGIEFFTGLTELACEANKLTKLDVSTMTKLQTLRCSDNRIGYLDLTKNTALTKLRCAANRLSNLDLPQNPAMQYLNCGSNLLSSLDLSVNTELIEITCNDCQLNELDLTKNTQLKYLACHGNFLKNLDVSLNTALINLSCYSNFINELDISNNKALESLSCSKNQLQHLDVTNNKNIATLFCYDNMLSELDISRNIRLSWLDCRTNQLTKIDISTNPLLVYLYCSNNLISDLSLSGNTKLKELKCSNNQLSSLDLSNNGSLVLLECNNNQLTAVDFTKPQYLAVLDCANNQFGNLDFSNNKILTFLDCSGNQLTQLNLAVNAKLGWIDCDNNQIAELILPESDDLFILECADNQLTEIDVSHYTQLYRLDFSRNHLTGLAGIVSNEHLSKEVSLDIRNNDLSDDDWSDVDILLERIGEPHFYLEHAAVQSGLVYSPQNGYDPYYSGGDYPYQNPSKERLISMQGTCNTRDLGGYKTVDNRSVKWRMLYRSDFLDLTTEDLNIFASLNLRSVCDLRTADQRDAITDRFPYENRPGILSYPIEIYTDIDFPTSEDFYIYSNQHFVLDFSDYFADIFQRLLEPENIPLLFHCKSGKDRAGFLAAMILSALGVPRETVLEDYLLTNYYREEGNREKVKWLSSYDWPVRMALNAYLAYPSAIQAAFDTIDETYGSFDNYLQEGLGVTPEMRSQLQAIFLEPAEITNISNWSLY